MSKPMDTEQSTSNMRWTRTSTGLQGIGLGVVLSNGIGLTYGHTAWLTVIAGIILLVGMFIEYTDEWVEHESQ